MKEKEYKRQDIPSFPNRGSGEGVSIPKGLEKRLLDSIDQWEQEERTARHRRMARRLWYGAAACLVMAATGVSLWLLSAKDVATQEGSTTFATAQQPTRIEEQGTKAERQRQKEKERETKEGQGTKEGQEIKTHEQHLLAQSNEPRAPLANIRKASFTTQRNASFTTRQTPLAETQAAPAPTEEVLVEAAHATHEEAEQALLDEVERRLQLALAEEQLNRELLNEILYRIEKQSNTPTHKL